MGSDESPSHCDTKREREREKQDTVRKSHSHLQKYLVRSEEGLKVLTGSFSGLKSTFLDWG